jgi:hypothetical protein
MKNTPLERLRHHVTGAIERGEAEAIVEKRYEISPEVKKRLRVERRIISRFVDDALAAGHRLSVSLERGYDHEDMLLGSRDKKKIVDEAMAGDEAHIFVHAAEGELVEKGQVVSIGWVYVVLGNDGWDVISDYSVSLESLLKGANELADTLSN